MVDRQQALGRRGKVIFPTRVFDFKVREADESIKPGVSPRTPGTGARINSKPAKRPIAGSSKYSCEFVARGGTGVPPVNHAQDARATSRRFWLVFDFSEPTTNLTNWALVESQFRLTCH